MTTRTTMQRVIYGDVSQTSAGITAIKFFSKCYLSSMNKLTSLRTKDFRTPMEVKVCDEGWMFAADTTTDAWATNVRRYCKVFVQESHITHTRWIDAAEFAVTSAAAQIVSGLNAACKSDLTIDDYAAWTTVGSRKMGAVAETYLGPYVSMVAARQNVVEQTIMLKLGLPLDMATKEAKMAELLLAQDQALTDFLATLHVHA
jgi:hypothetical protein